MKAVAPDSREALLAHWQKTRSPRLADLLCCTLPDRDWKKRLDRTAELLPRLALPILEALPDDPQTTVYLVDKLAKARWFGPRSEELWTSVFARLVALRDVRCVPALRAMEITPPRFFQQKFTRWIVDQIRKVADRLARTAPTKDDAATLRLAAAQTVEPPLHGFFPRDTSAARDALLRKVWAAPNDVDLRDVVGDALLELGERRGELIALQRGGKKTAKALAAFLDEHERELAGPIGRVASSHRPPRFVAGFVEECTIHRFATVRDLQESAVAPDWATVKSVSFESAMKPKWYKSWWTKAPLGQLRKMTDGFVVLERASADAPWRVTKVPPSMLGMRDVEIRSLSAMLKDMPPEDLARIVWEIPPAHPATKVGEALRARQVRQTRRRV